MGLIYLDTCIIIYLVEHPDRGRELSRLMANEEEFEFAISPLVKCECLVGPRKTANLPLERHYLDIFPAFASLPFPEPVFIQAAELRARFGLRTPDALHLACAQHHGCAALWTNDDRLTRASRGLARSTLG